MATSTPRQLMQDVVGRCPIKPPILERRDWRTHCSVDATQPSSLIENSEIRLTPDFGVCQIPVGRDRRDGSTQIQA